MYEERTQDAIQERILARIPDRYDKREGSLLQTLVGPIAAELYQAYADMDSLLDETYAASASYTYLVKRAYDRGILPIAGKHAVLWITQRPSQPYNTDSPYLSIGDELRLDGDDDIRYVVTALVPGLSAPDATPPLTYLVTCTEPGVQGNKTEGALIPVVDVPELTSLNIDVIHEAGTDDESEESLYTRYLESFAGGPCGGNVAWYKEKMSNLTMLRGVRIRPGAFTTSASAPNVHAYCVWRKADGTTLRCITLNDLLTAGAYVDEVQNLLDPNQDGKGSGQIPIGHILDVRTATLMHVSISGDITLRQGYSESDVSDAVTNALDILQETWADRWRDSDVAINVTEGTVIYALSGVDGIEAMDLTVTVTNSAADPTSTADSEPKFQFPVIEEVSITYESA